ncbi:hypothetical protein GF386_04670 [Candidatus Pacearchaeota archaeon]|nr:hypothetical protein [Candidatus Pacearchaeota archaeon]MBD3283410.1 hypothetical protein [Candidatus Pacearchaeota archaeon]
MKQAIVIFINNKQVKNILKKYSQDYKKFKPHITLVYPFFVEDQKLLFHHIRKAIKEIGRFEIILKGLKKSAKEYYLYLLIDKNKDKIMKIYRELNSGFLSGFKNPKLLRYIPHITLGVFKNQKQINSIMNELKKQNIEIKVKINKISLLTLNKNDSFKSIKDFELK